MGKKSQAPTTPEAVIRENEPTAFRSKKGSLSPAPEEDELCPQQLPQLPGDQLAFKLEPNSWAGAKPTRHNLLWQQRCRRPHQELPAQTHRLQITKQITALIDLAFWGTGSAPRRYPSPRTPTGRSQDTGCQPTGGCCQTSHHLPAARGTICAALQRQKAPQKHFMLLHNKKHGPWCSPASLLAPGERLRLC